MEIYKRIAWECGSYSGQQVELLGGRVIIAKHAPEYRGIGVDGIWKGVAFCGFKRYPELGVSRRPETRYIVSIRLRWFYVQFRRQMPDRLKGYRQVVLGRIGGAA